jgi:alcohol/geraniol dehydrogenase (NADP+)
MNTTLTPSHSGTASRLNQKPSSPGSTKNGIAGNYQAWVAKKAKQPLVLETVDLGPIQAEDVEIAVENCGLCHSDLSVLNNDWGISQYPAVLGHEVIGRVTAAGPNAKGLKVGQRVGVGWNSGSCMHCRQCMSGTHHLCPQVQPTIVGHRGAKPSDRVGIIGIGGLGHMAVKFAAATGCDVTAFTSSESKFAEAKGFGANRVVASQDSAAIKKLAGNFDLLISTVNVPLDWDAIINALAPNGRLHVVGAVLEPIPVAAFSLIMQQRSLSGSPSGSPVAIETMLDFASRHNVVPTTERFPMSKINEAFARLESGKAHYRIVLDADF